MKKIYESCYLCPRKCGVNRYEETGCCGMNAEITAAKAFLHQWEEPCISYKNGAGTVFFSGCGMHCVFCQNNTISNEQYGKTITNDRLAEIFIELQEQGADNIDLVTPTHYVPDIIEALDKVKHKLCIPVVYNTGGYERTETIEMLRDYVDIYLPDLKYLSGDTAQRYSDAADYPEIAAAAIREMVRQTGPCQFGEDGLLKKGVIIRHLVLPGQVAQAKAVMDWVAGEFEPGSVLFSLMSQYTPWGDLSACPEIDRRLRAGEMRATREYMDILGLAGFTQERTSAKEEYTPPFDLTGI